MKICLPSGEIPVHASCAFVLIELPAFDADKNSRGGNVFVSRIAAGHWKVPEPLGKPINSTYWEGGACVSPDGKRYFFTSERPGGFGRSDIWMVERMKKNEWGKPVNLGPEVNTPFDE